MVQVVDRVGALLGAFSQERPVLGLAECAERSGLSKSSAHRLLTSLVEIGLLERDAAGNWQIGELPLRLAAIRLSHRNMRLEVVAALVHLGQRFQAATAFSVPNGGEMVYVERTDSVIPFAPSVRLGSTAPMWTGAAGRAVLSLLEPPLREALCDSPEWTALGDGARARITSEVAGAAGRGYSVDRGEFFDGVAGVAVALRRSGEPVAAVSLIVSPERMTPALEREMGEALRHLVDKITRGTTLPATD
ncbi:MULTISPECIES: IclR family transcriptional regulator [Thermomonosporaceae]|uniref:IclR family transcriptional regulator n=1 Tax=Thermomonosporaceae TaxID=2012 RepID=UPI00255B251F|nr:MULTISPECIES: IclR family transcriptional regulator [Thermomonosporaceae]MDL4774351.1 IclR family transcriptional regulator [Actinomadura xylanilytica]